MRLFSVTIVLLLPKDDYIPVPSVGLWMPVLPGICRAWMFSSVLPGLYIPFMQNQWETKYPEMQKLYFTELWYSWLQEKTKKPADSKSAALSDLWKSFLVWEGLPGTPQKRQVLLEFLRDVCDSSLLKDFASLQHCCWCWECPSLPISLAKDLESLNFSKHLTACTV